MFSNPDQDIKAIFRARLGERKAALTAQPNVAIRMAFGVIEQALKVLKETLEDDKSPCNWQNMPGFAYHRKPAFKLPDGRWSCAEARETTVNSDHELDELAKDFC